MAGSVIDAERLRRRRFAAQLLAAPARSPADVADHMLGLQAQDLRAARLAVRARTAGLTAADVNGALDRRAVVIGWLFRGTLHMVLPDDYPWLLGLTAPTQRRAVERRLEQLGYGAARADAAVGVLEKALADGPQTRAQLRRLLAARGFDAGGQVLVHLLVRSSLRGVSIRGPLAGGAQSFVLSRDWLGEAPAAELSGDRRRQALAELARRYLRGHGPAAPADLAWWSGLPLRDATAGFAAIAGELRELGGSLAELRGRRLRAPAPRPRLLGAFDEYVLGWRDASFSVPAEQLPRARSGGWIRPVAVIDGRAAGIWSAPRRGGRLALELDLWTQPSPHQAKALAAEAADIARFEGLRAAEPG